MIEQLSRPNVIVLRGVSGAGKDYFARTLISRLPEGYAHKVSFAAKLREDTELVMPVPEGMDSVERDVWERANGFKYKMIEVANRELIKDPWRYLRATLETITAMPPAMLICTDCRSVPEFNMLLESCNVWVIRIRRPGANLKPMAFDGCLDESPFHITFDNIEDQWYDLTGLVAQLVRTMPFTR